jgi:RNA polymerase sigma factor (sigma-70 family)
MRTPPTANVPTGSYRAFTRLDHPAYTAPISREGALQCRGVGILSVDFTNQSIEALLPALARIVGFIRRRNYLDHEEAEDFASFVKLKIVERGQSILSNFRGRSSFETYLSVVAPCLFLDYRAPRWGSWRPSSVAKRRGPEAVRLEDLIHRQGRSPAEAIRELKAAGAPGEPAAPAMDDPVIAQENQAEVDRVEIVLNRCLATLPTQDLLIVRLHFFEGLTIASVAEVLCLRQKPLYRRIDRILESLREQLESAGVDPKTISTLIGRAEFGVGLHNNLTLNVGKRTDDPSMEL